MASVNVETTRTKWGLTHMVTGPKGDVKNWCTHMEKSSPGRVLCRHHSDGRRDVVTWRVDVDNVSKACKPCAPVPVQTESHGPGILACVAIGLGLGFFFGG